MVDVVDKATRSRMMSGIRSKDTEIELAVRKGLHRIGFRFRLHDRKLPGKPDLVFAKYRAVIFVHGCFWHAHNCGLFKVPSTRADFWSNKILGNAKRDLLQQTRLQEAGWRVGVIWECEIRRLREPELESVIGALGTWLLSDRPMR